MKWTPAFKVTLIILFVGIVSGCASMMEYTGTSGNIIGQWKFKNVENGPQTLTFTRDGVYELDTDGDKNRDIWGSYRLSRNWLILNDVGGDFIFDCGQEGAYQYKVTGEELTFVLMADQCVSRHEAMSVQWVKIHKDPAYPRVTPVIKL